MEGALPPWRMGALQGPPCLAPEGEGAGGEASPGPRDCLACLDHWIEKYSYGDVNQSVFLFIFLTFIQADMKTYLNLEIYYTIQEC